MTDDDWEVLVRVINHYHQHSPLQYVRPTERTNAYLWSYGDVVIMTGNTPATFIWEWLVPLLQKQDIGLTVSTAQSELPRIQQYGINGCDDIRPEWLAPTQTLWRASLVIGSGVLLDKTHMAYGIGPTYARAVVDALRCAIHWGILPDFPDDTGIEKGLLS